MHCFCIALAPEQRYRDVSKMLTAMTDGTTAYCIMAVENEAVNSDARFKDVERQAVDVINTVTNSKVKYSEKEEEIDMCVAIQEIREKGRLEGRQEGRLEGRLEGEIIGIIRFNNKRRIPKEETRQYIMEEYKKSGEEADELIKMYWK